MPQSRKSVVRFLRKMLELRIPSGQWNELNRQRLDIRRLSNLMNFSLLSEQAAGGLAAVSALIVLRVFSRVLLGGLLGYTGLQQHEELVKTLYDCALYVVYMSAPFLLLAFFGRLDLRRSVPMKKVRKPALLLAAIPVTLTFYLFGELINGIIVTLLRSVGLDPVPSNILTAPSEPWALVFFCVQICVLAPILEEFLFRGLIQRNLMRFGAPFAILTSSLLFSMMHGNLAQIPFAFVVGLVLGFFSYRFDSIWASVLLHACVNGTSVLINAYSGRIQTLRGQPFLVWICVGVGLLLIFVSMLALYLNGFYRSEASRTPRLPVSMAMGAFVATPGFLCFTALTVFLIIAVFCGLA